MVESEWNGWVATMVVVCTMIGTNEREREREREREEGE